MPNVVAELKKPKTGTRWEQCFRVAHCGGCGYAMLAIDIYDGNKLRTALPDDPVPNHPIPLIIVDGWEQHDTGVWHPTPRAEEKRRHYLAELQNDDFSDHPLSGEFDDNPSLKESIVEQRRGALSSGAIQRNLRQRNELNARIQHAQQQVNAAAPSMILPAEVKCPRSAHINLVTIEGMTGS